MTTLEQILQLIWLVEQDAIACNGLALRLLAGYESKECKESYEMAEKWRRKDFEALCEYPRHWVEAAYIIRDLRKRA